MAAKKQPKPPDAKLGRGRPVDTTSKHFHEQRFRKAKADILELDLAKRQGMLLDRAEVEAWSSRAVADLKEGVADLRDRLPDMLTHKDARAISSVLTAELRRLLVNFADAVKHPLFKSECENGSGI